MVVYLTLRAWQRSKETVCLFIEFEMGKGSEGRMKMIKLLLKIPAKFLSLCLFWNLGVHGGLPAREGVLH